MTTRETRRTSARATKIAASIEQAVQVEFVYRGERRTVSAAELREQRRGYRHRPGDTVRGADVIAYDHARNGWRTFKLDDIRQVRLTNASARVPS